MRGFLLAAPASSGLLLVGEASFDRRLDPARVSSWLFSGVILSCVSLVVTFVFGVVGCLEEDSPAIAASSKGLPEPKAWVPSSCYTAGVVGAGY